MPLLPESLLDAIHRGDDPAAATLVAADWLDENGEPNRARLLRLSAWLSGGAWDRPERWDWELERCRLGWRHGHEWGVGGFFPDAPRDPFGVRRRCDYDPSAGDLASALDASEGRDIVGGWQSAASFYQFAESEGAERVAGLELREAADDAVAAVSRARRLRPRRLDIVSPLVADDSRFRDWPDARHLDGVRELDVLSTIRSHWFWECPFFARLEVLRVGQIVAAGSPPASFRLPELRRLVARPQDRPDASRRLLRRLRDECPKLREFDLALPSNVSREAAWELIPSGVESLSLALSEPEEHSLFPLGAPALPRLRSLDLGRTSLRPQQIDALGRSPLIAGVERLRLRALGTPMEFEAAWPAFAKSPVRELHVRLVFQPEAPPSPMPLGLSRGAFPRLRMLSVQLNVGSLDDLSRLLSAAPRLEALDAHIVPLPGPRELSAWMAGLPTHLRMCNVSVAPDPVPEGWFQTPRWLVREGSP